MLSKYFGRSESVKFIEIAIQVANLKPERYQSKIYLVTMIMQISVIEYYKKYEILKSNQWLVKVNGYKFRSIMMNLFETWNDKW